MSYSEVFQVEPGSKVDLAKVDAGFTDKHESHQHALPEIDAYTRKLRDLRYLMYAENKRSLLICLQGRDAAGKDGTINHVLSAMNPQGCTVTGFKVPSKEESAHDFLWRYHQHTPGKGQVAIFNRSHYEDALNKTSTAYASWFVIPSNHKWFRNLAISRIVAETLESLEMKFTPPTLDIEEIIEEVPHDRGAGGRHRRAGEAGGRRKQGQEAQEAQEGRIAAR